MPVNLTRAENPTDFGSKAFRLFEVAKHGYRVPRGFVISHDEMGREDMLSLNEGSTGRLVQEIREQLATIDSNLLAVRSSSSVEDGASTSFAGAFESVINVPPDAVITSMVQCYRSIFSKRTERYLDMDGTKPLMSVIIQEMIVGEVSGVAFSANPVTGNRNEIVVEAANGLCDQVVSGSVTPYKLTHSKGDVPMLSEPASKGLLLGQSKWEVLLDAIADLERVSGYPVDIEWTFRGNELYILQLRPVTALWQGTNTLEGAETTEEFLLSGETANAGYAEWKVVFASGDDDDYDKDFAGSILVAEETTPALLPFMLQAEAILTSKGGMLSHAAIVSRELNKPCIVGIPHLLERLRDGVLVRVDAHTGKVFVK